MQVKEKFLRDAENLFLKYGLKSITMNDLARRLGISKKTLYQFVENKADLVKQIMDLYISEEKAIIEDVRLKSGDAVEEMIKIARHAISQLRKFTPTLAYDLQKYYQDIWKLIQNLHSVHICNLIKENIERGIQQGVYRSDLDVHIISKMYIVGTFAIVDENTFPQKEHNKEDLFLEFIKFYMQGITSNKGGQLFKNYLKKEGQ